VGGSGATLGEHPSGWKGCGDDQAEAAAVDVVPLDESDVEEVDDEVDEELSDPLEESDELVVPDDVLDVELPRLSFL
jgi:hypothetical protein